MNAEIATIKTAAETALAQAFSQARERLPGDDAVAAQRDAAFDLFAKEGLPHRRIEEWKYTDLRTLMREWRSGELGVLLLALTTAVAALTGVGFLVGRIDTAVREQATQVLAADIRVSSTQPLPDSWFAGAAQRAVHSARIETLLSVVFHGDDSQLQPQLLLGAVASTLHAQPLISSAAIAKAIAPEISDFRTRGPGVLMA